ncbi:MAG: EamA family transporter [Armatimonadota bacterium]|nr:EamA family transporter [Armatimonadota bacterium]
MTGELAALAAAVSFGMSIVLARRFMVAVPPEAGVLVSIAVNVVVFTALLIGAGLTGRLPPIHPWSVGLFVVGGLAGTLVGRNLSYASIGRLGASLATTVRLSNSIFTLLTGFLLLQELPRPQQLAGLVAVTLGLWISLRPSGTEGAPHRSADLRGVAMALGGAAAFALGDTARRAGLQLTPAPVLGAAVGACTALAAHLVWSVFHRPARWPQAALLWRFDLLGSAVMNTAAILLLYVGLRYAPVAIVSVLYNLQVLVVLLASPLLLRGRERITAWLVLGALVALGGTALILMG